MSRTLSRRNVVKGGAWAAPVVVATAAVPAYAASFTCPGVEPTISHALDSSGNNVTVTVAYSFADAASYQQVVVTSGSGDSMTLVGNVSGATLNQTGDVLTINHDGSASLAFTVTITIPTDQVDLATGTEVSFIYAIDGDCTTSTTYLIPADVSTQTPPSETGDRE